MHPAISRLTLALLFGTAIVASTPASATSYSVVHSFSGSDGAGPAAGLLTVVSGKLYGTTVFGGSSGDGMVFSYDPGSSTFAGVYSFSGSDGYQPSAAVISVGGVLYGTTGFGGTSCSPAGCGTVFGIDPSTGSLTLSSSFTGSGGDGANPFAPLLNISGEYWGTTQFGGSHGKGTIFSINPGTGTITIHYSFAGGSDGAEPIAGLTKIGNLLYGTTMAGGNASNFGTLFSYNITSGTETVLHTFASGASDGARPFAGVINVSGVLWGATNIGGSTVSCGGNGCGTVYSYDPSGPTYTVVHSFNSTDGANPQANLVSFGGLLYGTTHGGGVSLSSTPDGTIYSIDPSTGTETVLHSFLSNGTDGTKPRSFLAIDNGVLYGTTETGGSSSLGTIFAYTP